MLTDKAKEDYNKWCADKGLDVLQFPETEYNDVFQNALIIEWFDSAGVYINASAMFPVKQQAFCFAVNLESDFDFFMSRRIATAHGIRSANILYNTTYAKEDTDR